MNFVRSAMAHRAAIVILAAFGAALPQFVAAQGVPLAGTYNFVPARSTFMPGPARYKSLTLTITGTDMVLEGVDAQDKPVKATISAAPDGKPHPVTGLTEYDNVSWTRFSDTITSYSYLKRRNIVTLGNRMASADGNTVTFNEKMLDDKGRQTGTAVMVFAKPGFEVASVTPPPGAAPAPVVAPPPAPVVPAGPTEDEKVGLAALEKDDVDGAIAALTRAIEKKEKGSNAGYDHVMRGVAYAKKGMNEQALADFDMAVMIDPKNADARFRRGGTRVQLKQYEGAIEDMSAVIEADPMNAVAYRMRGFSYNTLNQNTKGTEDNEKACSLNKDYCIN